MQHGVMIEIDFVVNQKQLNQNVNKSTVYIQHKIAEMNK